MDDVSLEERVGCVFPVKRQGLGSRFVSYVGGLGIAALGVVGCGPGTALIAAALAGKGGGSEPVSSPVVVPQMPVPKGLFVSDRSGSKDVFVVYDDASVANVTSNNSADYFPSFSGDKARVLFTSEMSGNREVYVMNVDGGAVLNLSNSLAADEGPRFSSDSSRIVFSSVSRSGLRDTCRSVGFCLMSRSPCLMHHSQSWRISRCSLRGRLCIFRRMYSSGVCFPPMMWLI